MKVDLDGIQNRLIALDIAPADYRDLRLVDGRVFYLRHAAADDTGGDEEGPGDVKLHLCSYSLEDRKETVLGDVSSYQITADGKKMLVKIGKEYAMIDLPKDKIDTKDHVIKNGWSRPAGRSAGGMETDLLGSLAPDARLLLFADDEWRRLESHGR